MSLTSGTRLGSYEVIARIGVGGMGEVYEATDTRLKRRVALKVLPPSLSANPDRLARFHREAEVLAALNHPNIAQIHGLEESGGVTALVMELVEGPTLADRVAGAPIPIADTLSIAKQIAEALQAAHEHGVVHRDLKPANIKVREDGTVKVLDFGLAKAIEPAASAAGVTQSPTITSPALTQAGLILGTAAYMSPEQARGKSVDKRADIWAFGCVLYEMLTARRAFGGDEITDTLAFIITKDPDWSAVPPDTPTGIRRLLRRCLEKDARNRLHDIADARLEVQDASETPEEPSTLVSARLAFWRRAAPWAVTMLTVVVAALVIWSSSRSSSPVARGVVHFTIPLPDDTFPAAGGIALSRDGSRVAFVGGPRSQIHVRSLTGVDTILLADTAGASWLSFSPDGRSISYVDPGSLRRVAVDGGLSVSLAQVSTEVRPPVQHWRTDDTILFTNKGVLLRIPSAGGTPQTVGPPEGAPYLLPRVRLDGPTVVAFSGTSGPVELNLKSGSMTRLQRPYWPDTAPQCVPEYVPLEPGAKTGFGICYDRQRAAIMAARFDESRVESTGELRSVVEGVQPIVGPYGAFAVSELGTLAYVPGNFRGIGPTTLVWMDRAGAEEALSAQERRYESVAVSPDGRRIVMQVYEDTSTPFSGQRDIWVYDVARETQSRLTFDGRSTGGVWTRDGRQIVHAVNANNTGKPELRAVAVDGGALSTLGDSPSRWLPMSISPDGTSVAGVANPGDARQRTMSIIHVGKPGANPEPFMDLPQFSESGARFSPDGRFVAYASDETGRDEIYVSAYPPGGKWTVSKDGGTSPRWRADGRELFYRSGNRMVAVDIDTTNGFRAGVPKVLFERNLFGGPDEPYDVAPDGKRFLMLKPGVAPSRRVPELHVVVNWIEELKRLVP